VVAELLEEHVQLKKELGDAGFPTKPATPSSITSATGRTRPAFPPKESSAGSVSRQLTYMILDADVAAASIYRVPKEAGLIGRRRAERRAGWKDAVEEVSADRSCSWRQAACYTEDAWAEDRAMLRSNPSADPGPEAKTEAAPTSPRFLSFAPSLLAQCDKPNLENTVFRPLTFINNNFVSLSHCELEILSP